MSSKTPFVVMISANAEWRVVREYFKKRKVKLSPYGEWFSTGLKKSLSGQGKIIFIHGGWGKVAAAGSTQYVINRWKPVLILNLGTCGGFEGEIEKGKIILVNRTIIYDIYEQMGDPDEHLRHFITEIDTTWIAPPYPLPVRNTLLVSGDRDLFGDDIPYLREKFGAVAGDWESGAIAWVANRNGVKCLVLRGVSDLVNDKGGEAYAGNVNLYYASTEVIMNKLLDSLPEWINIYKNWVSEQ